MCIRDRAWTTKAAGRESFLPSYQVQPKPRELPPWSSGTATDPVEMAQGNWRCSRTDLGAELETRRIG